MSEGGGARGNVAAHSVDTIRGDLASILRVDNRRAASGGMDAETLEAALVRARADLSSITRAVTAGDYEALVRRTPGYAIARVKAIPLFHPNMPGEVPGVVSVIVVPRCPPGETRQPCDRGWR